MLLKFLPVALLATVSLSVSVHAQGRAPAETPPAGFAGQQYVDSRGCLFIRAGHGGQVTWVARIDRNRKPICGQPPSIAVMNAAKRELAAPAPVVAEAAPAPKAPARQTSAGRVPAASYTPPPVTFGAPTPLRRTAPAVVAAKPSAPAPVAAAPAAPPPKATGQVISRTAGCPDFAPVGKIYPLHRGGSILICANGPHRLTGLRPGDAERMAHTPPAPSTGYHVPKAASGAVRLTSDSELLKPPAGYRKAWRDDRLNPKRAQGTAAGHRQMLQVWDDKVPQQLRTAKGMQTAKASSKSVAPQGTAGQGGRFVQVGSFGVAENAVRAVRRLQGMGLPVQVHRASIKGKPVQVVRAGPFASADQATQALHAARRAGFGDAILRR